MELYHFRTFVAVAEEGRLSKAAEKLYISLPAVSAHVKSLEEELGVALFTRTSRGMKLTESGRTLLPLAEQALRSVDDFVRYAKGLSGEVIGLARIGLNTDPKFLRVTDLLSQAMAKHPRLEFHFYQGLSGALVRDVRDGKLDACFMFGSNPHPEISTISLKKTQLCVVAPKGWEDRIREADWGDLAKMRWVLTPPQCPFRKFADRVFRKRKIKPDMVIVAELETMAHTLAAAGEGVTILREEEALAAEAAGELAIWPGERISMTLSFAYPRDSREDPKIQALVDDVRAVWKGPGIKAC